MNNKKETEQALSPASSETLAMLNNNRDAIIAETLKRSMQHNDEVAQHAEQGPQLIRSGLTFSMQAIETAMQMGNVDILRFQIPWGRDRLIHDGVQPGHVLHRFEILRQVGAELLPPPAAQEWLQYVNWLIHEQERSMK